MCLIVPSPLLSYIVYIYQQLKKTCDVIIHLRYLVENIAK